MPATVVVPMIATDVIGQPPLHHRAEGGGSLGLQHKVEVVRPVGDNQTLRSRKHPIRGVVFRPRFGQTQTCGGSEVSADVTAFARTVETTAERV